MSDTELWQIYNDNGTPILGKGASTEDFKNDSSLIMGNAHVWFWRKLNDKVEILLQKRSLTKARCPGMYHISAGGHINVGENSVQAALRETKEEMGIDLDANKLHYVASTRIIGRSPNDIVNIFIYELKGDTEFTHTDGEVDSYEWRSLDDFKKIVRDAKNNNLVNQGLLYFNTLLTALEYMSEGKETLL